MPLAPMDPQYTAPPCLSIDGRMHARTHWHPSIYLALRLSTLVMKGPAASRVSIRACYRDHVFPA